MQSNKPKFKKSKGFIKASEVVLAGHPKAEVFKKALHRHQVIRQWDKTVSQFFESAENQSKAIDFKDGVLFIACLSKDLANKIKMFAQRIIYVINQIIGKQLVFALRVDV